MKKLRRMIELIRKELMSIIRDKKTRIVLIAPPLIQLLIFSYAATLEVKNVNLGILNEDRGKHGYELSQRFSGSGTFKGIIFYNTYAELEKGIDEQHVIGVLRIPQDFSRKIERGDSVQLQIILDGRKSNASQIVQGYAAEIVNTYSLEIMNKNGLHPLPAVLVQRSWFNENLFYLWFIVPSMMGILTMIGTLILTALSVAREREQGTFDQLLVSPLMPNEIIIGKTLPALIVGMLQGTLILLFAYFVFRVPFTGSLVYLYFSLLLFAMACSGIGLFISSIAKTQQQGILGAFVFMVPAVALSGFASPYENMPQWLQNMMQINPVKHFLIVSKGIYLKDMPWREVWHNAWPLLIIASTSLALAGWLFKKRLE
jgi:ABC-2 type transport system permease protein